MSESWIIVLNWNGRNDTLELLDSLQAAELSSTTVLVVDNASKDGTLEAVRYQHPWVQTLQTGANLGFAGGNNQGILFALAHGADIIGVLNNDTMVSKDFWPPLVAAASRRGVAVSPDIRYADDPGTAWFYGAARSVADGWPRHLEASAQPPRSGLQDTEVLTGCCLVTNAATWKKVGLFDERLFLIFEDSDWSMRARKLGVRLVLQPESIIEHKVSRSFQAQASMLGSYYFCRNGLIFAWRWTGPLAAGRFFCKHVARATLSGFLRVKDNHGRQSAVRALATIAAISGLRGEAGSLTTRVASTSSRSDGGSSDPAVIA